MARHAENCSGEVEDAENGAPTPKRGRRGRKRKMRSRRDEDDSGETLTLWAWAHTYCVRSTLISSSDLSLLNYSVIQRRITLNLTRRRRRRRRKVRGKKNPHCCRKRRSQKAWNWTRPPLPSLYRPLTSHQSKGNEADPRRTPLSLPQPASQSGWLPRQLLLVRTLTGFIRHQWMLMMYSV